MLQNTPPIGGAGGQCMPQKEEGAARSSNEMIVLKAVVGKAILVVVVDSDNISRLPSPQCEPQ